MIRIAVFVSGEGTNLQKIYEACQEERIDGEVVLVVSDRLCKGIIWADSQEIPIAVLSPSLFPSRHSWGNSLEEIIKGYRVDLICLAGFLKILSDNFVVSLLGSILNIHPGLLPQLAGKDPQRKAIELGLKETGNTVHIVTNILDDDSFILAVDKVEILDFDTEENLSQRLKESGYETYITAINQWIAAP